MDEYKWIIYVIAALYFILRSRKKKAPEPGGDFKPFESENAPSNPNKPVTFEDLLREIQQTKAPKPEFKPEPVRPAYKQPEYVDYDEDLKSEERDLEEISQDYRKNDDQIYETYEKAKSEAFNRRSLEETMKVEDTVVRFGHFKGYDIQQTETVAQSIAKDFQNPENIKKAFILSEILNRKY
jgi:hypothetical protein